MISNMQINFTCTGCTQGRGGERAINFVVSYYLAINFIVNVLIIEFSWKGCPIWLILPARALYSWVRESPTKWKRKKKKKKIPAELIWRLWFSTRWNCYLPVYWECNRQQTCSLFISFMLFPPYSRWTFFFSLRNFSFMLFAISFFSLFIFYSPPELLL